ncbi:metal ABC transporter ATP-binding protein [Lacticaseibacillus saniviri]
MTEAILSVDHLDFGFRDQPLYRDLTFELAAGSMTSLVGANGVGKTTLIRLLMGQLKPQQGEIQYRQTPAVHIGYVPQFRNLEDEYPLSIRSFIGLNIRHLWPWATTKDKQLLDQVIEATHLEARQYNRMGRASGGEKQKAYLAQALLNRPNFLILDESTASLDVNTKVELMDLVKELNQKTGLTVLFVTHDLNLAKQYTDQYLLLKKDGYEMKSMNEMDVATMPEELQSVSEIQEVD